MGEHVTSATGLSQRLRDTFMTWPWLTVELRLLPWHWKLVPRPYYDHDPIRLGRAGYRTFRMEWLFLVAEVSWNIPAFRGTWKEPVDSSEVTHG